MTSQPINKIKAPPASPTINSTPLARLHGGAFVSGYAPRKSFLAPNVPRRSSTIRTQIFGDPALRLAIKRRLETDSVEFNEI